MSGASGWPWSSQTASAWRGSWTPCPCPSSLSIVSSDLLATLASTAQVVLAGETCSPVLRGHTASPTPHPRSVVNRAVEGRARAPVWGWLWPPGVPCRRRRGTWCVVCTRVCRADSPGTLAWVLASLHPSGQSQLRPAPRQVAVTHPLKACAAEAAPLLWPRRVGRSLLYGATSSLSPRGPGSSPVLRLPSTFWGHLRAAPAFPQVPSQLPLLTHGGCPLEPAHTPSPRAQTPGPPRSSPPPLPAKPLTPGLWPRPPGPPPPPVRPLLLLGLVWGGTGGAGAGTHPPCMGRPGPSWCPPPCCPGRDASPPLEQRLMSPQSLPLSLQGPLISSVI